MSMVIRGIAAVVLGVIAAFAIIAVVEIVNALVFLPRDLDWNDRAAMMETVKSLPPLAFVVVLMGWALGTFCGAWVTARVMPVGKMAFGLALGVLFMVMAVVNMLSFPHPVGMWGVGLAEFLPVAYLGARLATLRRSSMSLQAV